MGLVGHARTFGIHFSIEKVILKCTSKSGRRGGGGGGRRRREKYNTNRDKDTAKYAHYDHKQHQLYTHIANKSNSGGETGVFARSRKKSGFPYGCCLSLEESIISYNIQIDDMSIGIHTKSHNITYFSVVYLDRHEKSRRE
jgi:hypothetical protein